MSVIGVCFRFFFQAEDGIRDIGVTGVDVCSSDLDELRMPVPAQEDAEIVEPGHDTLELDPVHQEDGQRNFVLADIVEERVLQRSEERRVEKACRSRWSPYH